MSNIKETAKKYLQSGLSVVFLQDNKRPNLSEWKDLESQALTPEEVDTLYSGGSIRLEIETPRKKKDGTTWIAKGIKFYPEKEPTYLGIIAGKVSGGLEVIDVDCKYDITGYLWDELKTLLQATLGDTFNSLVIATTTSGGYHIYYRCEEIEVSLKLANRPTTEEEREKTYQKNFSAGLSEERARLAQKNDKTRVLIETRGEGGYVAAPPSKGYEFIQGKPSGIPSITPQERACILAIASDFNQVEEAPIQVKKLSTSQATTSSSGLTSLEDYDQRGDAVALLISHGWTEVGTSGEKVNLLRPGETLAKNSGNYHTGKRALIVFSTSTQFEPRKPYSPSQIFNLLECGGDWTRTAKELGSLGYGSKTYTSSKELKTEKITVEAVNQVTRETSVISTPGKTLSREEINALGGKDIVITSPGNEAQEEVLRAIKTLQGENTRIYIKEGAVEVREYKYQLQALFQKYGAIQQKSGGLSDRETDNLLDEVVIISQGLQPIDRDIFKGYFLSLEPIKELGIKEESLDITLDRLTSTKEKEAQAKEFKKLLATATELQDKGEIKEALELLETKVKDVKLKAQATEFSKLLIPTSEAQIKSEEANLPDSLNTGFKIDGEELLLPGGAISVYSAPTNHGKTILLINSALNVAERYPDKQFIFFTYEERDTAILQYFLNTYLDENLNTSDKGNRRLLRDYFKTGSTQYISREKIALFERKKEEFFKTYIETGRILVKYVDYNSQELTNAIEYLHKENPAIGGVFIDYFQLLRLPKEKNSRQEELKQICMSLKDTAIRTGLPLCLAAQFNREVTNLMRLHPTNIGEAGDIERIVNNLVGLWNMDKKPVLKGITQGEEDEINLRITQRNLSRDGSGNMYLEILKSRDLPTGSYEFLDFNGNTGKLKNKEKLAIKAQPGF
jgi:replicative DNA helicase